MKKVPEEKIFSENLGESLKSSSEKREDDWFVFCGVAYELF